MFSEKHITDDIHSQIYAHSNVLTQPTMLLEILVILKGHELGYSTKFANGQKGSRKTSCANSSC